MADEADEADEVDEDEADEVKLDWRMRLEQQSFSPQSLGWPAYQVLHHSLIPKTTTTTTTMTTTIW